MRLFPVAFEFDFYPRPPRGGRHNIVKNKHISLLFLSTPSARRATPKFTREELDRLISIHALREEGDAVQRVQKTGNRNFYPRPPRGGRQNTSSVKVSRRKISIHALREEGDPMRSTPSSTSSRFLSTPSARRATYITSLAKYIMKFLSTPSARRATLQLLLVRADDIISIHALREEGDSKNRDKFSIFKQIIQHSARI